MVQMENHHLEKGKRMLLRRNKSGRDLASLAALAFCKQKSRALKSAAFLFEFN
tara:strand:+ start:1249 stop:1407 length:159 start_codon:yes stop_codon:yes gene_type:complete